MRDQDRESAVFELRLGRTDRGGELNRSGEDDVGGSEEVEVDATDQAIDVNGDVDEDVEAGDGGDVDRDEAAVAVVDEEVGAKRGGGEVVDAAGAVGDVAEDEAVRGPAEGGDDVGEGEGIHKEALGELEGDARRGRGANAPDALVDFEVVVGREEGYRGVEVGVVEDGVWDLALHEPLRGSLHSFSAAAIAVGGGRKKRYVVRGVLDGLLLVVGFHGVTKLLKTEIGGFGHGLRRGFYTSFLLLLFLSYKQIVVVSLNNCRF